MQLTVTYDGPEVAAGRMDARDLASAMLSTARLFEHTAQLMYGTTATLKIDVKADFQRGSFSYDIITQVVKIGETLFGNLSVSDIIETSALLILAVKLSRGRRPKEIVREPEPQIVFHEGDVITVNEHVVNLYFNTTIRRDLEGAVEPLRRPGIDEFRLVRPEAEPTVVLKSEVEYFEAPVADEDILQDAVQTEIVQVVAPHFREGDKWEFALAGEGRFFAAILDATFLRKVARQEVSFGSGDALRVRMRVRVTRKPKGDYSRLREIVEVLDLIKPDTLPSFFDQP